MLLQADDHVPCTVPVLARRNPLNHDAIDICVEDYVTVGFQGLTVEAELPGHGIYILTALVSLPDGNYFNKALLSFAGIQRNVGNILLLRRDEHAPHNFASVEPADWPILSMLLRDAMSL